MGSVYFLSLGCDKNLTDSESMLGLLQNAGWSFTDDPGEAEVIIVNTCSFIGDAKKESINAILELAKQKEEGCCRARIATGCLAERYKDEICRELPELDAVLGTASYQHIVELTEKALQRHEGSLACFEDVDTLPQIRERILTGGGYSTYLKIAEGCDKRCTYCAIPMARGRYRSYPMELEYTRTASSSGIRTWATASFPSRATTSESSVRADSARKKDSGTKVHLGVSRAMSTQS